jgi:hypothetical protein
MMVIATFVVHTYGLAGAEDDDNDDRYFCSSHLLWIGGC